MILNITDFRFPIKYSPSMFLELGRNPSARSVMRWFHVKKKPGTNNKSDGINFPMKLEVTHRKRRDFQSGQYLLLICVRLLQVMSTL